MSTVLLTPCERYAAAEAQLFLLLTGKGVAVVETPQLGRVEFTSVNIVDLQRLVNQLKAECAASQGQVTGSGRRRAISVEAWP